MGKLYTGQGGAGGGMCPAHPRGSMCCIGGYSTLLSASRLCGLLQRAQQCRKNWALLNSHALPSSAGNVHRAKAKQHPCLPGNRHACSTESPGVVLAEGLVSHGQLGLQDLTATKWQLKHWINAWKGLEALGTLQHKNKIKKKRSHHINLNRKTSSPDAAKADKSWPGESGRLNCSTGSSVFCSHKAQGQKKREQCSGDDWNQVQEAVSARRWGTARAGREKRPQLHQETLPLLKAGMPSGTGGSTQLCKDGDPGILRNFEKHRQRYSSSTWLCYMMSANTARMPLLPLQPEQSSRTKGRGWKWR